MSAASAGAEEIAAEINVRTKNFFIAPPPMKSSIPTVNQERTWTDHFGLCGNLSFSDFADACGHCDTALTPSRDTDIRASDVSCLVRQQPQDRLRHLVGGPRAAHGDQRA